MVKGFRVANIFIKKAGFIPRFHIFKYAYIAAFTIVTNDSGFCRSDEVPAKLCNETALQPLINTTLTRTHSNID